MNIGITYHAPKSSHPGTCKGCTLDESKHGKPIEGLAPIERMRQEEIEEKDRWNQMKGFAAQQGLLIVQHPDKKTVYLVVKVSTNGGCFAALNFRDDGPTRSQDTYFTRMTGDVVFRGTWRQCEVYVQEKGVPLPKDLCPR
jgi:hypothetical protein